MEVQKIPNTDLLVCLGILIFYVCKQGVNGKVINAIEDVV